MERKATAKNPNGNLPIDAIIGKLTEEARKAAYKVGKWLWVEFDRKPEAKTIENLKELGFHWNKTRKVWQHSGGFYVKRSPDDPRGKYDIQYLEDEQVNSVSVKHA